MGKAMGISNNVMNAMIKEIDVNKDGTINVEEWVEQIKKSKQTNNIDMRGQSDNNILLDYLDDKQDSDKAMRRKKNLNLNDDYKLNDIEMNDAFKIAKRTSQKQNAEDIQQQQDVKDDQKEEIQEYIEEVKGMILGSKVDKGGKKYIQVDKKKLAYVKQRTKELKDKDIGS